MPNYQLRPTHGFFIKLSISISWLLPVCSSIVLMNTACQINTCLLWWIEMFGAGNVATKRKGVLNDAINGRDEHLIAI
jgi:hypothetical protein